jgi:hypothetical protein
VVSSARYGQEIIAKKQASPLRGSSRAHRPYVHGGVYRLYHGGLHAGFCDDLLRARPENQPSGQFFIRDGLLFTTIAGEQVHFYSYPDTRIPVPQEAVDSMRRANSFVVLFNASDEANLDFVEQVRWEFSNMLDKQVGAAVVEPSSVYAFPVRSCADATESVPMLRLASGGPNITAEGHCITLRGDEEQLLFMRDQFLFAYWGLR